MGSKKIFIFLLVSFFVVRNSVYGQVSIGMQPQQPATTNDRLALQYFEQREFAKANVYFGELYDKHPDAWYSYYFKSLLGAGDFSKAEKITRKQLKQNPYNVYLYVHLGRIYNAQNETKKEKEAYEKAIKELSGVPPDIQNLANTFMENNLYDYAIRAYDKARKTTPDYPYYYERAEIYKAKNDLAAMINEYLDALEFRETDLETVKRSLQNSLGYDDEAGGIKNPVLRSELQKRIVKDPDKIVLTEFLIFILEQQKDFDGAFVQERALDKRLKREGYKIYELARTCVSNERLETAKRCYDYLVEKGLGSVYYDLAIIEGLHIEYLSLTQKPLPVEAELALLAQKLTNAHEKYKNLSADTLIIRNLARIKAYYLNKPAEAIELLEEYLRFPGVDALTKARFKIMLGDIYLIKGEIWEASLLYSQVEKVFKHESIGFDAKFKNAKLSFYAGDFPWAKTQADVLKGATSKLTANDAMDLSLVISDAIGVDTNDVPLRLFASAELLALQHRYDEAILRMDSINQLFSQHTLGDDINYKKAQIYFKLGKYTEAEAMYKSILEYYPNDLYGDDALFKMAELYEKNINNVEKAKQAYQEVLTKYPGSIYTVEARKRYRILRGDNLNN